MRRAMTNSELVEIFDSLPPGPDEPPPPHTWPKHRYSFRRHVKNDNINEFLRWSTVSAVMFVGNVYWVHDELMTLKQDPDWPRWYQAILEDSFGSPERLPWMLETSGNMIHQAYHLFQWEKATGRTVKQLNSIVEFGGGYGAMARLVRRLGFRGEYIIYDLPELAALQAFYLSNVKIPALIRVTDENTFPDPPDADLLIACYSLSEISKEMCNAFLKHPFKSYLIVSQDSWGDRDLYSYFNEFMKVHPELNWRAWRNPILDGHYYWVGYP